MAKLRAPHSSPNLVIDITPDQYDRAMKANSGGCLIADSIKRTYPELSHISVDMATIRATDKEQGRRYTYLTPQSAQHCLLAFDQGWDTVVGRIELKRAVQVMPITRGQRELATHKVRREKHIEELVIKQAAGELTPTEKGQLTRYLNPQPVKERPTSAGPTEVHIPKSEGHDHEVVVVGGTPLMQGKPHANLLRGRDRHFGAKLADAGVVFNAAVEKAVQERLAAAAEPVAEEGDE